MKFKGQDFVKGPQYTNNYIFKKLEVGASTIYNIIYAFLLLVSHLPILKIAVCRKADFIWIPFNRPRLGFDCQ